MEHPLLNAEHINTFVDREENASQNMLFNLIKRDASPELVRKFLATNLVRWDYLNQKVLDYSGFRGSFLDLAATQRTPNLEKLEILLGSPLLLEATYTDFVQAFNEHPSWYSSSRGQVEAMLQNHRFAGQTPQQKKQKKKSQQTAQGQVQNNAQHAQSGSATASNSSVALHNLSSSLPFASLPTTQLSPLVVEYLLAHPSVLADLENTATTWHTMKSN